MRAMLLREVAPLAQNSTPLSFANIPEPNAAEGEVLIRVTRCGVCHTELDEIEGRTPPPHLPIVLGHQVVGVVESRSSEFNRPVTNEFVTTGQRVGVAWIAAACGHCHFCLSGQENLCAEFKATGRDINGGYAEYMKIREDFVHRIPDAISDAAAAPLLCAGAVGYRAWKLCNLSEGQALGLMGFGGSNHIVLKTAKHKYPNSSIFVFSRNLNEREFALSLGAVWAG
ncbi:MAG TPA: alcohol dehydrogenase catalytic domain-containing protein, partial [Anaerolineales bacterium]|nr:alcohol dehydrogenase catalytic domain-containing protein [Anaerolineales bacterium]